MHKFIGLELAKKLDNGGCKLPSEYIWVRRRRCLIVDGHFVKKIDPDYTWCGWELVLHKGCNWVGELGENPFRGFLQDWLYEAVPAYDILWGICVTYGEKFFRMDDMGVSGMILRLLKEGKKGEAEIEIWENCKFNEDNQDGQIPMRGLALEDNLQD